MTQQDIGYRPKKINSHIYKMYRTAKLTIYNLFHVNFYNIIFCTHFKNERINQKYSLRLE